MNRNVYDGLLCMSNEKRREGGGEGEEGGGEGEEGGGERSRDSSDNIIVALVNHRAIINVLTQFSNSSSIFRRSRFRTEIPIKGEKFAI